MTSDTVQQAAVEKPAAMAWCSSCLPSNDILGQKTGGIIKQQPQDFVVEELAAYEPSGTGDHLFLWVEKENVSATAVVSRLAGALGVSPQDVGSAGLKDTRAITRQYLSVPNTQSVRAAVDASPDLPGIRILSASAHGNKLKTGHLRGNRFVIRVRQTATLCSLAQQGRAQVAAAAAQIKRSGLANFYGPQRFGFGGETVKNGLHLLGALPGRGPRMGGTARRLALSAVQSSLFNRWLFERLEAGLGHTVLQGDMMQVVASGGPFVVDDPQREQARLDEGEVVVTGPIFGGKMRQPTGEPLRREQAVLKQAGLTFEHFARHKKLTSGTRRPSFIHPKDLALTWEDASTLVATFTLSPGSYATVLLAALLGPLTTDFGTTLSS